MEDGEDSKNIHVAEGPDCNLHPLLNSSPSWSLCMKYKEGQEVRNGDKTCKHFSKIEQIYENDRKPQNSGRTVYLSLYST